MTVAEDYLTLQEAAGLIPGATAATLKRRARQGKLTVYRPGKAYLTTLSDVQRMLERCRVEPRGHDSICAPSVATGEDDSRTPPLGLSETVLAFEVLDSALARATPKKTAR